MKLFDNKFTVIEKGLDAYSTRAKLLSNNIANVNTPKYKREDIQFEGILAEALNEKNPKIEGKRTNKRHFEINSIAKIDSLEEVVIKEQSTSMRNDKNNVDIEKEEAEFALNNVRYQFAINRISQNFNIIKTIIKSR